MSRGCAKIFSLNYDMSYHRHTWNFLKIFSNRMKMPSSIEKTSKTWNCLKRVSYGKDLAILSAFILPVEEKAFVLAHFTRQNTFFFKKKDAQNQRAKLIFWKWVKLLLYNFGLFQQVFENLKLNKLVKEERRSDLEDRIWRLKFWSCIW